MTAVTGSQLVGDPVDRVDGPLKVRGAAPYPSDVRYPGMAYAALVQSTIAAGTISSIDTAEAEAAPGVLAVLTHENIPDLAEAPLTALGSPPRFPLQDDRIVHHGQHVALVVAGTSGQAAAAARLIRIGYQETPAILDIADPDAPVVTNPWGLESERGDVAAGLASADVVCDETFTIAAETNNPLGLFATVARWDGDRLVVHDSTQWPMMERRTLADVFGIPEDDVRVLVPYLGGAFGAGLRTWPHTILTALAARIVNRPVKLVLTRPQMFTSVGHRPETVQRVRLGATREGRLVALDHEGTSTIGTEEANLEPITMGTPSLYACPNVATHDRQVRLNIPNPGPMRAPGTAQGNFAIESALDELSYAVGVDPIELRLRNHAEVQPGSGLPWSSNALRECYLVGADRFGWAERSAEPRSMRDGTELVGYGMAGAAYHWYQTPCRVRISIGRDGTAHVRSAATDLGTGTYTVTTQLAAELLGLDVGRVRVEIGDSDLPPAPQSGGSGLMISLGNAVHDAAATMLQAFIDAVAGDEASPLRGRRPNEVAVHEGRIHLVADPSAGETYAEILARHGLDEITVDGEVQPQPPAGMAPAGAFAAHFVEVRVDEDLGLLRIARVVSAVDGGRILNEKTARSQITGATVMGIGMAMLEETVFDPSGRIANATFGDYLIPVNADVPTLDAVFVGEPDKSTPIGIKGLGEVGIVGVPAAIANAVHHATGRRIRSLPITMDRLL
ncbi:xanthine dehydrogenase family protein molybdopterin-binding subunit [Pseudonocardia xinjiangensis]|uniref:Xanthine dehydrogenase family protein molybdopterin-binding subunit n=1 Tax=Pseudonocardia xinjiangensis TaxID=75289 RepID=A0ABX1RKR0_9PSEU|nr:xanthine dehydrogenase family protein molybdopterin-binding subunit [Pseudonocardia xinjiangensis]NMH80942.1 xanthine dehydrogenase family protein molybdopterin-binding subunit [Pseudonocardia xinjiangensis]